MKLSASKRYELLYKKIVYDCSWYYGVPISRVRDRMYEQVETLSVGYCGDKTDTLLDLYTAVIHKSKESFSLISVEY